MEHAWREMKTHFVHCVNRSQRKRAQTYFVQFGHIQCHRASPKMSHKRISWMKSLLAGWHRARLVASLLLDASSQRENRSGRLGLQDSQIQVSFSWYFRIKLAQTSTVKLVASRLSSNFIHGCWLAKKTSAIGSLESRPTLIESQKRGEKDFNLLIFKQSMNGANYLISTYCGGEGCIHDSLNNFDSPQKRAWSEGRTSHLCFSQSRLKIASGLS